MQNTATFEPQARSTLQMIGLSVLVGTIAGFGAVLFRALIALFHNIMFFGSFNWVSDANNHAAPSPWGMAIILVPVIGAIGVTWLVNNFAPEAKGHGVPEVIDAIYYKKGKIRPHVALFKSLASALSIGSGASVGREGPIVQIGSAFGSSLGQLIKMPTRQRIILIAAGAGAGIAATFNTPIGGLVFAAELLLVTINAATISVVAIATVTAAYIGRVFLGLDPAFDIPALTLPEFHLIKPLALMLFIPFGVLIGVAATIFIHSIYWMEDKMEALIVHSYLRNILGMSLLGVMIYGFMAYTGHYYVQGVGYATITSVLNGTLMDPKFLFLLCAAKLVATSLSLGSGASGGVFSPSLFLGATLGAAFGGVVAAHFPQLGINPIIFAVAGMAGMVSGATGAVITAITMLFEMTRDYNEILPIILTVVLAYGTRTGLSKVNIYTLKLTRRGRVIHEGLQAATQSAKEARHIMNTNFSVIQEGDIEKNKRLELHTLVHDAGQLKGVIKSIAGPYKVDENIAYASPETSMLDVLRTMHQQACEAVIVVSDMTSPTLENIQGVITSKEISRNAEELAVLMN